MDKAKLIFGLCIFTLIFLGSAQDAQAGWWDDFVTWVKDVFGFETQLEAEQKAKEIYGWDYSIIPIDSKTNNITLYGEVKYIFEDEQWKDRRDARSFKGSPISCIVEFDGVNDVDCLDYNETSRQLKINKVESLSVPLKKFKEIRNETTNKLDRIYDKQFEKTLNFNSLTEGATLTVLAEPNEKVSIGLSSTNTTLSTADVHILDDTNVHKGVPTTNFGTSTTMDFGWDVGDATWLMLRVNHTDIANLVPNQKIDNATLFLYKTQNIGTPDNEATTHGIWNTTWGETEATWDSNPCAPTAAYALDSSQCNNSASGNHTWGNLPLNEYSSLEITSIVEANFTAGGGEQNFSVLVMKRDGSSGRNRFATKEAVTVNTRPYVEVITSDAPSAPTTPDNNAPENNTRFPKGTTSIDVNWSNSTDANGDALTYYLEVANDSAFSIFAYVNSSITETANTTGDIVTPLSPNVDYFWRVLANDGSLNSSFSEAFNFSITGSTAPSNPIVNINSTDATQTNYTNETLSCNFDCTGVLGDNLNYDLYFYENETQPSYQLVNQSCGNPSFNSINLESGNTTVHYNYFCSVNVTNGIDASSTIFSNNLTIQGIVPSNLTFVSPSNESIFENNTFFYNATADDEDGDTIYFEFYQDTDPTNPPTTLLSNETSAVENLTVDGNYWVRVRAVDEFGGQSEYLDSRYITIDNSTVKNYTDNNFSASTTEGKSETFLLNLSWNHRHLNWTNATLIWQNTPYSTTDSNNSESLTIFTSTFNIPIVNADPTTAEFYWNVSYAFINGSVGYETTENFTQTINKIGITDCSDDPISNSTQAIAVNYTFYEEATKKQFVDDINASLISDYGNLTDFKATLEIYSNDVTANNTIILHKTKTAEVDICITPVDESYNVIGQLEYFNDSYNLRNHYYDRAAFSNQTQNTSLYLLSSAAATLVTITVQDNTQAVVSNVYIKAQRYDVGNNTFDLVAMGRSDKDGKDTIPLRLNDAWYRFILEQDQKVKYIDSTSRRLSASTLTLKIDETTLGSQLRNFETLTYSLTNTSDSIVLTFTDVSGVSSNNCLTVYRRNSTVDEFVCYGNNYCLSSSSGTITCNIGNGTEGGEYIGRYYSTINPTKFIDLIVVSNVGKAVIVAIGVIGLFGAFFIILTMGLAGVSQRTVSATVIFIMLGVIASRILNLLDVSFLWISILGIVGGIVIVLTKD